MTDSLKQAHILSRFIQLEYKIHHITREISKCCLAIT